MDPREAVVKLDEAIAVVFILLVLVYLYLLWDDHRHHGS